MLDAGGQQNQDFIMKVRIKHYIYNDNTNQSSVNVSFMKIHHYPRGQSPVMSCGTDIPVWHLLTLIHCMKQESCSTEAFGEVCGGCKELGHDQHFLASSG